MIFFIFITNICLVVCIEQHKKSCDASLSYNYMSTKTDYELVGNKSNFIDYQVKGINEINQDESNMK
jgi:hypothetical protein